MDKALLPMDLGKRRRALGDVVARLEERNLRQQKKDEFMTGSLILRTK